VTPTPTLPPGTIEYTVGRGDTLFSIAQKYGTTVEAIVELNGIEDPDEIEVGQVLLIPAGGPTSTPAPTVTETPSPSGPAQTITIGNTSRRIVALTFDAGADVGYTALILDTLKTNGIRASFGMTGKWAEQNPDLLRRIVNEGHELMNHSYDHSSFTGGTTNTPPLTQEERWQQLDRTEQIVQDLAGGTTKPYFRPPYGAYDQSVLEDVGARGYAYNVMWTVDSRGWLGIPEAEIIQRCLDLAEPGAIYIFHVGGQSLDGPALQDVIDGLRDAGYEMGNVSDVLE
jgi:peptidoglycan/xylan/chitin deacetylase (PgdA/CDA1 family)